MIRRPPRSTLFPYTRSSDLTSGKPTVALVLKTLNHPFFVDMRRGAQEAADQIGRAHSELQSLTNLVCRLLLEKKKGVQRSIRTTYVIAPGLCVRKRSGVLKA